jgi:hypothetical protein
MLDNLMNDMVNPLFTLAAGGGTGALRESWKEPASRIKLNTNANPWVSQKMAR